MNLELMVISFLVRFCRVIKGNWVSLKDDLFDLIQPGRNKEKR